MKKILLIQDTITNKITYYHIVCFLIALPFDRFFSQLVLISLIIHTLIHLKKADLKSIATKEVLILQSVYLITVFSTIYTNNKEEAFTFWTRQLAVLLFPLILFLTPLNIQKYLTNFLSVFTATCIAVVVYLYYDALQIILYHHLPFSSILSNYFLNHNFTEPIGLHATYFAMYIAICLAFVVFHLIHPGSKQKKIFCTIALFILVTGLMQLASRAVLISVLLFLNIVFPLILEKQRRIKFVSATVLLSILVVFILSQINIYKHRYFTDLETDLTNEVHVNYAVEPRIKRWALAIELIKQAPVIGYGTGEEVSILRQKYFEAKLYSSYLNKLNAHNQYLSFLLKGGILALIIYLFTLFYGFKIAFHSRHLLLMCFTIIISIVSLSENILEVNKGIFFYSFFFSLFLCSIKRRLNQHYK